MKNQLKIGDRVNVKMIITESWESEAGMCNGILKGIRDYDSFKSYWVEHDRFSFKMPYHRELNGGHYDDCKYIINNVNS